MAKALKKSGAGKALVSMKDLEGYYVDESQAAAAAAPIGDGLIRITTSDSMFRVGDTVLPDPLHLIVVAESLLNIYYDSEYDSQVKSPPACFAVSSAGKDAAENMHAHPTSPNIQGGVNDHDCATCEQNRFGSAEKGRGKACANTRSLAVVMADDPGFKDDSDLKVAVLSIAPTGLTNWGKYVKGLSDIIKRPPWGVVTQFSFNKRDPVETRRKAVVALGYKPIDDINVAQKIKKLRERVLKDGVLVRPLPVADYVRPEDRVHPSKAVKRQVAPAKKKKKAA